MVQAKTSGTAAVHDLEVVKRLQSLGAAAIVVALLGGTFTLKNFVFLSVLH